MLCSFTLRAWLRSASFCVRSAACFSSSLGQVGWLVAHTSIRDCSLYVSILSQEEYRHVFHIHSSLVWQSMPTVHIYARFIFCFR